MSEPAIRTPDGRDWPVRLVRHPRARRYRLSLEPCGSGLRLSLPVRAAAGPALAWAREQGEWIADAAARQPAGRAFVPGQLVTLDGRRLRLIHDAGAPRAPALRAAAGPGQDADLVIGGPIERFAPRFRRWVLAEALARLTEDTACYAARLGRACPPVAIGDPRRRWGSCSADGRIRYSWRLLLAPPEVRRATAAHEVAHLLHMHHGPAFHAEVARLFGDEAGVAAARAWLRDHGAELHAWRL